MMLDNGQFNQYTCTPPRLTHGARTSLTKSSNLMRPSSAALSPSPSAMSKKTTALPRSIASMTAGSGPVPAMVNVLGANFYFIIERYRYGHGRRAKLEPVAILPSFLQRKKGLCPQYFPPFPFQASPPQKVRQANHPERRARTTTNKTNKHEMHIICSLLC